MMEDLVSSKISGESGAEMESSGSFSENFLNISKKEIARSIFFFFLPACIFSLSVWFIAEIIWAPSGFNLPTFWKFFLLLVLLAFAHSSILMFLRQFRLKIFHDIYKHSVFSGFIAAPAVAFLNISPATISYNNPWESAAMILLMCMAVGWGITIMPYLLVTLWYSFGLPKRKKEHHSQLQINSPNRLQYPLYLNDESRYEYIYGTTYSFKNIPLIEVQHKALHIGYLDSRQYKIHGYNNTDLGECWWRIFLKKSDAAWVEVSARISQAKGGDPGKFTPKVLESQVSNAVKRVLEVKSEGFSFRRSPKGLPKISEKISRFDKNLATLVPLYLALEAVVRPAIKGDINRQMPLGIQMELARVPNATYVIDVVDISDYSHYYIAVGPGENHKEVVNSIEANRTRLVHKVWEM